MSEQQPSVASKSIKSGSTTYFFDVPIAKNGEKYLKITSSRYMGPDKESQRNQIFVFAKTIPEFKKVLAEVIDTEFK